MLGNVIQVTSTRGLRLLVCLLLGVLLLLVLQKEMMYSPTNRFARFSMDDLKNKNVLEKINTLPSRPRFVAPFSTKSKIKPNFTSSLSTRSTQKLHQFVAMTTRTISKIARPQIKAQQTNKILSGKSNVVLPQRSNNAKHEYKQGQQLCTDKSIWGEQLSLQLGRLQTNMDDWKFTQSVKCPNFNISEINYKRPREKLTLKCNKTGVSFNSVTLTYNSSDVFVAEFGDKCVNEYIQSCCRGVQKVPNVVHYVWYMRGELSFVGFISLLGTIRFIKPCAIVFHGDNVPHGKYWDYIVNISPNIIYLKRNRPEYFAGQKIKHREHSSDIMRLEALIQYGGIYMDTDTVIVNSLEPLRNYSCVMSNQSSGLMGSAFVMAEKNATFLQLWMDGYRFDYKSSAYTYNAMVYSNKVAQKHPDLIHIEYTTISRPRDMIGGKIYYTEYATYDWSYIYGIHLYSRIYKKPFNEHSIRRMNTTAGSISRHVVFGNKELCERG